MTAAAACSRAPRPAARRARARASLEPRGPAAQLGAALPEHRCTWRVWRENAAEFCLGAPPRGTDCEVVQYVSGMARRGPEALLLAYGANDCTQRLAEVSLASVRRDLRPVNRSRPRAVARTRRF